MPLAAIRRRPSTRTTLFPADATVSARSSDTRVKFSDMHNLLNLRAVADGMIGVRHDGLAVLLT
jgi:hypothetical protein